MKLEAKEKKTLPKELEAQILEYRAYLQMELGRGKNTVLSYLSDVSQFANFIAKKRMSSFDEVDADSLINWIDSIYSSIKSSTQSRKISAMKSLAGFLVDEKVWAKNFCDLIARPKVRRNVPDVLTSMEVASLMGAPKGDEPEAVRDRAMLELMYSSGLRVSELCSLKESDIDVAEAIIRVYGKGAKTRLVPVGEIAIEALADYKKVRSHLSKRPIDELFITRRGAKISRKTFWFNIKKYALQVGIKKPVKPHILRHSFATHLLQNGANLMSIREMLGHSDLATTQIYTQLLNDEIYREHSQKHPRSKMNVETD